LFHKITALRSAKTPPGTFRSLLRQVTYHLGYEATQNLKVQKGLPVTVPLGKESQPYQEDLRCSEDCGIKLLDRVALVPILRSGLGMTEAVLELLPNSAVHHIGMYRTPGIHVAPVQYFNRLPRGKCGSDVAYVLDPIVGSAKTVMAVVSILKQVRTIQFVIL
jgi:uracil phosphoribosyltransferase